MENFLEGYTEELLHAGDAAKNKLVDLGAGGSDTYYLSHKLHRDIALYAIEVIRGRLGKTGNTVLRGSAAAGEQVIGKSVNDFDWRAADGTQDPKRLAAFISAAYKDINLKGNNPLFLSVGAVRRKIAISEGEVREVATPLLIFPIRLIRALGTSPVCIEFVDDDAYFNPCLIYGLRRDLGEETAESFPHPNGAGAFDEPISLEKLGGGEEYFAAVRAFMQSCKSADGDAVFEFEENVVAISEYDHADLCMYYDIRRNRDKIYAHPLVRRVFTENLPENKVSYLAEPDFVLPRDSVQEDMIRRAVNGESLIIKGPPGTGKTLTIANMIAALMGENKKVLLASKKLSALSEVYAKLPAPLRRFALLLDCETETQAAKVNPSDIKADLRALVRARREYAPASAAYNAREHANAEKSAAITFLSDYISKVFTEGAVAGGTYYDALGAYFKNNMNAVPFAPPEAAAALTRVQYEALLSAVKEAGGYFDALTGGGKHPLAKCPWAGVDASSDTEGAYAECVRLAALAEQVHADICALLPEGDADGLRWQDVLGAMLSVLTEKETRAVIASGAEEEFAALSRAFSEYLAVRREDIGEKFTLADAQSVQNVVRAGDFGALNHFTAEEAACMASAARLFAGEAGQYLGEREFAELSSLTEKIAENGRKAENFLFEARRVFSAETLAGERELLRAAADAFSKYGADADKPRVFDFKGKKLYEKLSRMSFTGGASFAEAVAAVSAFGHAEKCREEGDACAALICKLLRAKPQEEQMRGLALAFAKDGARELLAAASARAEDVRLLAACVKGQMNAGELYAAARAALAKAELKKALFALFEKTGIAAPAAETEKAAYSALALRSLFSAPAFSESSLEDKAAAAQTLRRAPEDAKRRAAELREGFANFGEKFFGGHYAELSRIEVGDLCVYAAEAGDRSILSAALRYKSILHDPANALPLYAFFAPFERGEAEREGSFADMFEHSFYALAVADRMKSMGLLRNGLGKNVAKSLTKLAAAERKIEQANVSVIEGKCMARIDPNDPSLSFLASERDPQTTLRSLFKKYPKEILKLKRCFILSPSTASVLFRPEEYADFDAVIIDEASQLEPVNLLPVLFRAKQCIIVGDEWQMPPIKHFAAKYERRVTDEDGNVRFVLEPELSALTLALRNRAFRAEELICHYRSKTESLIAFSQRSFYPFMRTFPAPVPRKTGLGFTDVYVPEGRCEKGVNMAEAEKAVALLKEHFERYYDEADGTLAESVGVVAFGEEQTECIRKLVRADRELRAKIDRALSNFKDVPEKLIFFKTIETVQGQETAQLILSLTYGKTAEGKTVNSFGQLNRDKLGKCIFNVAVTRAQCGVAVIHSVRAEEITGESVSYIREYLELAARFAEDGRSQFVSEEPPAGFIKSVADFIASQGIARERIACDYGVTEGSVRIPVAVLSQDLKEAQLGVWCEKPTGNKYNYLDYNMRYADSLKERGWNLYRIYAHDWADNAEAERDALAAALKKYVN